MSAEPTFILTKDAAFKNLVRHVKQYGQGIALHLVTDKDNENYKVFLSLVDSGLAKIVRRSSYFGGEEWLCLTKGYCVEEEEQEYERGDKYSLLFIRYYLGFNDLIRLTHGDESNRNIIDDSPKLLRKYNIWLDKNKSKLDELANL